MIGSLSICAASNNLNHEYQPEIEGSQHPESNGGKASRNPRIFFGVSYIKLPHSGSFRENHRGLKSTVSD